MTDDKAITLAIDALEKQIQSLAIDADLCDKFNYVIPRTTTASKERAKLRQAIATLQQMRPRQVSMDLEAA